MRGTVPGRTSRWVSLAMVGMLAGLLAVLLAPVARAWAPSAIPSPADTTATTIFFIRHAEKNPHPVGGDSGLNTRGLVRAQVLTHVLRDAGVTEIYSSQFGRSRLTVEPLAQAMGDSVRIYDANDLPGLAARLRSLATGTTVLVVGHSDTIPQTIEELIGRRPPEGEPVDYDRMYVLTLNADGSHRLLHLRYGAP